MAGVGGREGKEGGTVESEGKGEESEKSVGPGEESDSLPLFPPCLLEGLELSLCPTTFSPALSVAAPGQGLLLRPLQLGDYRRGFLALLAQLTEVGEVSWEAWRERFLRMRGMGGTYLVTVVEDTTTGQVGALQWISMV